MRTLSADWDVPVEGDPIADGAVAIADDGRIAAVGTSAELGEGERFAEAVQLTHSMLPLASEVLARRQRIAAHEAWGKDLLALAESQPALLAETTRAEARQHFREAGACGEGLAELTIATRTYIDDLAAAPNQTTFWSGVRNYQARNFMRDQMKPGDRVLFYHSSTDPPAIVGARLGSHRRRA